jgi:hypothetical protein
MVLKSGKIPHRVTNSSFFLEVLHENLEDSDAKPEEETKV